MASAKATIDIDVPPDDVWQLIGGFGSLPEWLPYISHSELTDGGRVRHINNPHGQSIIERLEKYSRLGRTYSYSILQSPFPVTDYLATIIVTPRVAGEGSRVEWSGTFNPNGVSDDEAHSVFQGIFSDGLKALASRYANKKLQSEELVNRGFTRQAMNAIYSSKGAMDSLTSGLAFELSGKTVARTPSVRGILGRMAHRTCSQ